MPDHGKRSRSGRDKGRDATGDRRSQKRRLQNNSNRGNSSEGELVVYRILCPSEHIGSVIGKGGKVINTLRQATNAKIKVVDPFPGCTNRVLTIYCYVRNKDGIDIDEDNMKPICASQDALLKVHAAITNSVAGFGDSEKKNTVEAKVLAPASQAASIIGKSGCSIKKIRANTNASIKINPKDLNDPSQFCAMSFDNLITVNFIFLPFIMIYEVISYLVPSPFNIFFVITDNWQCRSSEECVVLDFYNHVQSPSKRRDFP